MPRMTAAQIPTLYEWVGGIERIEALFKAFYERVPTDPILAPVFAKMAPEHFETVAGLIFTTLGRVPAAGTSIVKNGYRFTVERADRRRIYRVRVTKEPEDSGDETYRT